MRKSVHDLPDGWREVVLKEYSEGASDTEVRAELGITYKLWAVLLATDPSFEDIVLHGRSLAKAWWLKAGRKHLMTQGFNATLYKINMQNRFNWNDKTSTVDEDPEYEDEESLDEQIELLMSAEDVTRPN